MIKNISSFWERQHRMDILLMFAILLSPLILPIHLLFDDTDYMSTFNFFGYSYEHRFINNRVFIWMILTRLIPLLLFFIWFFKSSFRWKYILYFPIFPFFTSFFDPFLSLPVNVFFRVGSGFFLIIVMVALTRLLSRKKDSSEKRSLRPKLFNQNFKKNYFTLISYLDSKTPHYKEGFFNPLKKVFYVKSVLDMKNLNLSMLKEYRPLKRHIQIAFTLLLILIPFLYYSYLFIPVTQKKLDFSFITITNNGFVNVRTFIWYMSVKFCVLIPLCIWFLSSNQWWKYAILCPIILYSYQIIEVFEGTSNTVDEEMYLSSAPIILILIGFLIFVSNIVKYQFKILDIYDRLSLKTEKLLHKLETSGLVIEDKRLELTILKEDVSEANAEEKLNALLKLRNELIIKSDEQFS